VNLKLEVIKRSFILPYGENYYGPQQAWNFMRLVSRVFSTRNAKAPVTVLSRLFFKIYIEWWFTTRKILNSTFLRRKTDYHYVAELNSAT